MAAPELAAAPDLAAALGFRRRQFFGGDAERRRCGGAEVKWCALANRAANGGSSGAPFLTAPPATVQAALLLRPLDPGLNAEFTICQRREP